MPNETNVFSSSSTPLSLGVTPKPLGVISLLNGAGEVVRRWRLQQPKCTIGSDRQATIWIDDPALSSFHALLVFGVTQTIVKCFSTGTRLNGNPIREASLQVHDRLEIGPLTFLVEAIPGSPTTKNSTTDPSPAARAVDTAQLSANQTTSPSPAQPIPAIAGGAITKLEGQVETLLQRLTEIDTKISQTSAAQKKDLLQQCDSLRTESKQLRQVVTADLVEQLRKLSEDLDRRLESRDAQADSRLKQIIADFQRFQSTIENRIEQLQVRNDSQVQNLQTNLGELASVVESQQPFDIQSLERRLNILEVTLEELRNTVERRELSSHAAPSPVPPKPPTEPFRSDGTLPHPTSGSYRSSTANTFTQSDARGSASPTAHPSELEFTSESRNDSNPSNRHSAQGFSAPSQYIGYESNEDASEIESTSSFSSSESTETQEDNQHSALPSWFTGSSNSRSYLKKQDADPTSNSESAGTAQDDESISSSMSDSWGDGLDVSDFEIDRESNDDTDDKMWGDGTSSNGESKDFPVVSALDILRSSYSSINEEEDDNLYAPSSDSASNQASDKSEDRRSASTLDPKPYSRAENNSSEKSSEDKSTEDDGASNSTNSLLERLKREMAEKEAEEVAAASSKANLSSRSGRDKPQGSSPESLSSEKAVKPAQQHSSHQHSPSSSAATGTEAGAEDDSVEAYMQKLLARMRGDEPEASKEVAPSANSPKTVSTKSSSNKTVSSNKVVRTTYSPMRKSRQDPAAALIASRPQAEAPTAGEVSGDQASAPVVDGEVKEGDGGDPSNPRAAAEKSTDFRALRELANDSARTAIKSSESKIRPVGNIIKLSISALATLFGIQLLYENGWQVNLTLVAAATAFMLAAIWCMDVLQSTKASKKSDKKNGSNAQVQMKIAGKR